MKIEDSPYQFKGTSPVDKLRRTTGSFDVTLDELDLTFLELLSSVTSESGVIQPRQGVKSKEEVRGKEKASATQAADEGKTSPKLNLVGVSAPDAGEEAQTRVDRDMTLLKDELSDVDVQYMKQIVVPGLPILVGSVPFNSIFPSTSEGEISYRGFDVSSKLAELIEKGYRTGRPIRVELDPRSAVVLKIRNGEVSAEFVSSDKAAAFVMQQELDDLRSRMAARNLPVGTLEYKYQNPDQPGRQQRREDTPDESQ